MSTDYSVCLHKQLYVPVLYTFTTNHIVYIQQLINTYIQQNTNSKLYQKANYSL